MFALIFSREYLTSWPTFPQDIMVATLGENVSDFGANIYLKILLAIDSEVVDRTIDHTTEVGLFKNGFISPTNLKTFR